MVLNGNMLIGNFANTPLSVQEWSNIDLYATIMKEVRWLGMLFATSKNW